MIVFRIEHFVIIKPGRFTFRLVLGSAWRYDRRIELLGCLYYTFLRLSFKRFWFNNEALVKYQHPDVLTTSYSNRVAWGCRYFFIVGINREAIFLPP